MICPKCGKENYDDVPECPSCFYKFRFGYGYHDPAKGDTFVLSRAINSDSDEEEEINPTRSKIITIGLILMAIAMAGPIIFMLIISLLGRGRILF